MTNPPEREIGTELTDALHHSTGSYELVIGALAAAGLGFWIDYVVGTVPVFTLIFSIAGFIGASYSIFLRYRDEMASAETERLARRSPNAAAAAKQAGRARDERLSGAERSAPNDQQVLRANAAAAAKQGSKSQ